LAPRLAPRSDKRILQAESHRVHIYSPADSAIRKGFVGASACAGPGTEGRLERLPIIGGI
jgi:hypothetical protein